jgi:hypothetical protein
VGTRTIPELRGLIFAATAIPPTLLARADEVIE